MRVAYFDCFHGAAGDMMVGALIDAGLSLTDLRTGLAGLRLPGYSVSAERVRRASLSGTQFRVQVEDPSPPHRHLGTILELIESSDLSPGVRERARAVFDRLARAEASVHGVPIEHVHFHEVGAIDSLVDVVGVLVGLELLGVGSVCSSPLTLGSGTVETSHGILPVPAPATAKLVEGFSVRAGPADGELLTPTAAALLTTLATDIGRMPEMRVERTGFGAGARETARPNLLRVFIGTTPDALAEAEEDLSPRQDTVTILEANIDDMPGEWFGFAMERLFEAGALDVYTSPLGMKKSRPGVLLGVVTPPGLAAELARIILEETTTLGVRAYDCRRWVAQREIITVDTQWGRVRVKVGRSGVGLVVAPEYEDCRGLARSAGLPLKAVYEQARVSAMGVLKGKP